MLFLLDEDVNPKAALVAEGLGVDTISVHSSDRLGMTDDDQLGFAQTLGRILVTRNRDDFLILGRAYYTTGRQFPGILIVPHSLPNDRPEAIGHALRSWVDIHPDYGSSPGFIDFLGPLRR